VAETMMAAVFVGIGTNGWAGGVGQDVAYWVWKPSWLVVVRSRVMLQGSKG